MTRLAVHLMTNRSSSMCAAMVVIPFATLPCATIASFIVVNNCPVVYVPPSTTMCSRAPGPHEHCRSSSHVRTPLLSPPPHRPTRAPPPPPSRAAHHVTPWCIVTPTRHHTPPLPPPPPTPPPPLLRATHHVSPRCIVTPTRHRTPPPPPSPVTPGKLVPTRRVAAAAAATTDRT